MTYQKVVKVFSKSLASPQPVKMSSHTSFTYKVCSMSIEILASKFPDVMGTDGRLSHTVLSCIFLCPHFWARRLMLMTYWYWLLVIVY